MNCLNHKPRRRVDVKRWVVLLATLKILFPVQAWPAENPPEEGADDNSSAQKDDLLILPKPNGPAPPQAWGGARPSRKPQLSLFGALGSRGTLSESRFFEESLNLELGLGLPFWNGVDFSLASGRFLMPGNTVRFEAGFRSFLFFDQGGPYLGASWGTTRESAESWKLDAAPIVTLGLFGGNGLYAEFDFRGSSFRPVAMIFEFGIRLRKPIFQPTLQEPRLQGELISTDRSLEGLR